MKVGSFYSQSIFQLYGSMFFFAKIGTTFSNGGGGCPLRKIPKCSPFLESMSLMMHSLIKQMSSDEIKCSFITILFLMIKKNTELHGAI